MNKLQQESYEWFKKLLKTTVGKEAGEDYSKGDRRNINSGSMLFFKYPNPKTPLNKLKMFDKYPLIILLRKSGRHFLGINSHWIPKPLKEPLLKMIIKLNSQRIKNDKTIQITYQEIKEFLVRNGLDKIAVKKYLINRIVGLQYIPYKEWKYQLMLPTEKIITDSSVTAKDVEDLIRSALSQARQSKNVRYGRSTNAVNKRTSSSRTKSRK